jgi:hypothetical protein
VRGTGELEASLLREVRQLALDMIRLETWARQAHDRGAFARMLELQARRTTVRERRSELLRQIWNARHPSRQVVAVT